MSSAKKILKWLDINLEPLFIMVIFIVMTSLITLQVIKRFIYGSGFAWGEEFSVFMFVWIVFLGISYAFRNNRQIGVHFLRDLLPEKIRKVLVVFVEISMFVLMLVFLKGAISNVQAVAKFGDKVQSVPISLNILYYAAVSGYSLSLVRLVQSVVWKVKRFNASYELFLNQGGLYSGASTIFFMPKEYREAMESKCVTEVLEEEALGLYKKNRGGASL
jgi:TRAP-type C4-dicarboxylate transport system permease small subunit